ncbi:MAG: hypothetical protein PHN49_01980 [Candidatus Omnitrophica bacterium]|nr:hypothetical protein [Candidatus Omnitrophota bacterium]
MTYIDLQGDGTDQQWLAGAGGPFPTLAQYVNGGDPLGDAQYLYSVTAGDAVTFQPFTMRPIDWPRAHRFDAIRVVAWVRVPAPGVSATCRFRLRILGQEYASEDHVVLMSAGYQEISWYLPTLPDGNGWSQTRLWYDYTGFELGLVFVQGDELRCTKFHTYAIEEPYPHWTLVPTAPGTQADWAAYPTTLQPWETLQRYNGDESYCHSTVGGEISVFPHDPMGIPFPTVIERVRVALLAKNMSSTAQTITPLLRLAGVDYRGGCDTLGSVVPADSTWRIVWTEFITDPSLAWPAGNPAGGPWTQAQVNAAEIGFENTSGGDFRVTSLAIEVTLTPPGSTVIDWFPTANGFHVDFPPVVPNVGEAAWEDVDEDPPDDAASYIEASATTAGTPQYCSFVLGGAGVPGANERIYLVELTARIRLGNLPHSTAEIVPVLRDTTTLTPFFGKPVVVEDTGLVWFDVRWNIWNSPLENRWAWATADSQDVHSYEFGVGVTQGDVLVSRVRARILTCPDYPAAGPAGAIDLQLTNAATALMIRANLDGTLYAVTEFAVGTGGYDPTAPGTVVAVNPADVALTTQVWRGPVTHVQYQAPTPPWSVQYWCRLPQGQAIQGIGEVGLYAEILWSPFPWEIGMTFLWAKQHMPLQARHANAAGLFVLQVDY